MYRNILEALKVHWYLRKQGIYIKLHVMYKNSTKECMLQSYHRKCVISRCCSHCKTRTALADGDFGDVAAANLSSNDLVSKTITNFPGNESVQRACTKFWVVTSIAEPLLDFVGAIEHNSAVVQSLLELLQSDVNNVAQRFARQSTKDDEFVKAVDEFGCIVGLGDSHNCIADFGRDFTGFLAG